MAELTFWQGLGAGALLSIMLFTPKGRRAIGRGMSVADKGISKAIA